MLDFFTIFSKGGIVLWYFQGTTSLFTPSVNALIKNVILQERLGNNAFTHESLTLKYKIDHQYELVFVVAYQKILTLSYVDKFLDQIQLEFRDKYKNELGKKMFYDNFDFSVEYKSLLKTAEENAKKAAKMSRPMRQFENSTKSQKTVASMIINKDKKKENEIKKFPNKVNKETSQPVVNGHLDDSTIMKNREKLFNRGLKKVKSTPDKISGSADSTKKKGKEARKWDGKVNSKEAESLDFSSSKFSDLEQSTDMTDPNELACVGKMKGNLQDIEPDSSDEEEEVVLATEPTTTQKKSGFSFMNGLRSLVGSKILTEDDISPVLSKFKDHLIAKNVAADIADQLCQSVSTKLVGTSTGTFTTISNTVKKILQESCVQLLSPRRRIDILRDAMDAREHKRPYTITFCGVNGVGKSTNLAKVCFWLIENGFSVLIAACDTFRAGAVEQLRTHKHKLNALHPPAKHGNREMVQLYEKGYGKDAAGIAMEAINYARDMKFDVVLIDTAGRMQDNEPLMRALSKLIQVNRPDLVLFVGEALVGNEAVDQLTKFNLALADHSSTEKPRLIDGILLTKFDTIDDQVGAAISMTYTTGQPIVFVGTGQTYTDLKNLNAKVVVNSLLKS